MTGLGAVLAAAVVAGVLYAVLLKTSPGYALLVSLAAATAVIFRGLSVFEQALRGIADLGQQTDGQAFACLARCAGVLLLTDYARTLCEEAGADSLAWCAAFAGRCLALSAAWPLLNEICQMIWELTR